MKTVKLLKFMVLLSALLLFLPQVSIGASLAWDPPSGDVTGYKVYYSTTQSAFANFLDVGNVTQCSLDHFPLEEKNTYYFVVSAYNSAGESGYSNDVNWTQPDVTPPMPPIGITVE